MWLTKSVKTTEVRVHKKMESVAQVLSKWVGVTKRSEDEMGKSGIAALC